jgi:hypothetical protein
VRHQCSPVFSLFWCPWQLKSIKFWGIPTHVFCLLLFVLLVIVKKSFPNPRAYFKNFKTLLFYLGLLSIWG